MKDIEGLSEYFKIEDWKYVQPLKDADTSALSASEKKILDKAIEKYGELSFGELKEKSHDIAWRSTARDYAIKWDDIAREAGLDSEEIAYLKDFNMLQESLR